MPYYDVDSSLNEKWLQPFLSGLMGTSKFVNQLYARIFENQELPPLFTTDTSTLEKKSFVVKIPLPVGRIGFALGRGLRT